MAYLITFAKTSWILSKENCIFFFFFCIIVHFPRISILMFNWHVENTCMTAWFLWDGRFGPIKPVYLRAKVHIPRQESDPSCLWVMGINFDSFSDFCIGFCNCYEHVILFDCHFISRNATSPWIHWTLVGQRHTRIIWCLSLVSSNFIYICSTFVCFMFLWRGIV